MALIDALNNLKAELMELNQYNNSNNSINKEIEESNMFAVLAAQEKELSQRIKQVTDDYKNAQNEYAREQHENTEEIKDLRTKVNEAKVEKELHIQYLQRIIEGAQSCQDRLYRQKESDLQSQIDRLRSELDTENEVNSAVKEHLQKKQIEMAKLNAEIDDKLELEKKRLEQEKQDIKEKKTEAAREMTEVLEMIHKDDEARKQREEREKEKEEEEIQKVKDKMSMEDAAKYIQRKWVWYQQFGKQLAKKKRGGKKKGGKKKKK